MGAPRSARHRLAAVVLGVLAVTVAAVSQTASPGVDAAEAGASSVADARPNVVVLLTDDMRLDDLRYLPNVRRLLTREGRRYTQALAPQPLCCPMRAQLLTGQYGHNNGVQENKGAWGGYQALRQKHDTIAAWLQAEGYRTFWTGKYMNGYEWEDGVTRADTPRPPGWTIWDPTMTDVYAYWRVGFWNGDHYRGRYVTSLLTHRTNRAIERFSASGDPFVLVVNHLAPHSTRHIHDGARAPHYREALYGDYLAGVRPPLESKPSFNRDVSDLPEDLQRRELSPWTVRRRAEFWRARVRSLRSVDDSVAAVVRKLEATGELANTYVVFASDNGTQLGEHRIYGKDLVFQESLRIPLVVRGPGIAPGSLNRRPVTLVDLPASILEWTGAAPGRTPDGVPMSRFDRPFTESPVRDTILVETGEDVREDTEGWSYRGVVTRRYTYAEKAGRVDVGLLFDHAVDRYETSNLFHDERYARVRAELGRRTTALQDCMGDSCNQVFGRVTDPEPR